MEESEQGLRVVLFATQQGDAVLPNSAVVEVLPFATPLRSEHAPEWVIGNILWRARTIPLVSLERIAGAAGAAAGPRSRIVVVHALGGDSRLLNYGLLAADAPKTLNLERSAITVDDEADPPASGILSRVRVHGEPALIPDLDDIETDLIKVPRI